MRPIGKFVLGFGMVSIPVKVYPAVKSAREGVALNQLHAECGSRVTQPKYCPTCERFVEMSEIAKGWEVSKDKYVQLTEEDMQSLPLSTVKSLAVDGFMPITAVDDPRWFKDCYFLSPEEPGLKGFVLFSKAMEALGVMGVSKIALKGGREALCTVRAFDSCILLQRLNWGNQLQDYGELQVDTSVSEKEMEMAKALISAMTKEIDLYSYQDEYKTAMLELIAAKLDGKTIVPSPEKPTILEQDLADILTASLEAIKA